MHAGKMLRHCRLCSSSRIHFVLKKDDVCILKCIDCGVVFLGNQLDENDLRKLYKYYSSSVFSNYLSSLTKLRYEKLLDSFEKYRKNNTIIDVGCGAGYFMLSASNRGWGVEGTEISDEAIKISEDKGQKVLRGDISSLDIEKDKYDVAVLTELLEHAETPDGIIKKLHYALRPGGIIYITTPNYKGITRRIAGGRWGMFSKEHIFYFTPKVLKIILKKYGFKIKKIKTENLFLIEILRLFKKPQSFNISKSYEKQEYIRSLTERKRFFSILKKMINLILNIFKIGDTIYILAEKKESII